MHRLPTTKFGLFFVAELSETQTGPHQDQDGEINIWRAQTAPTQPRHREWTPLDLYNDRYLDLLEERKLIGEENDHIKNNIVSIKPQPAVSGQSQLTTIACSSSTPFRALNLNKFSAGIPAF